jgi:hypothetical protein
LLIAAGFELDACAEAATAATTTIVPRRAAIRAVVREMFISSSCVRDRLVRCFADPTPSG